MPQFTIDLSKRAVDKLQKVAKRTSRTARVDLDLVQWITLHLREVAISDDLTFAAVGIREVQQRDAQESLDVALEAERDRLLLKLG
ncbi:MAG: hypothetical protein V3S20_05640 [Dehalococcoidia bacterium]